MSAKGLVGVFGIFAGLCTVFVLIVCITDGWSEHAQESWPQATATIEKCSLDPYVPLDRTSRTPVWHIGCKIGFRADAEIETKIRSRSTASGWGGHKELMGKWLARHPSGCTIVVRYDPTDPRNAVLTDTDMPDAGPRTPNNLRLLLISSVACVGLLTIARRLRSNSMISPDQ